MNVLLLSFSISTASSLSQLEDNVQLLQLSADPPAHALQTMGTADGSDEDSLTVMLLNTYLVEVDLVGNWVLPTPNLAHRATGIAEWFNTLSLDETPDVLVFNEMNGPSSEKVMQSICDETWEMFGLSAWVSPKMTKCRQSSRYEMATPGNGPKLAHFELFPTGGVVILVKKGLNIDSFELFNFPLQSFPDQTRGITVAKVKKQSKSYTIIGTHLTCCIGAEEKREKQLKEIRDWVDENAKKDERVLIVGDFNIFQFPTSHGTKEWKDEVPGTKKILGGNGSPAIAGDHDLDGFWLPLDREVKVTWDNVTNFHVNHMKAAREEYGQAYDWVFAPGSGDWLASPADMKFQYVPVKSSVCYKSELMSGLGSDDLADHYGVFTHVCYKSGGCPSVTQVSGHTGVDGRMPGTSSDCTATVSGGEPTIPKSLLGQLIYQVGIILGLDDPTTYTIA